jgi:hypothetical protein
MKTAPRLRKFKVFNTETRVRERAGTRAVTLTWESCGQWFEMGVKEQYRQLADACLQKAISAHSAQIADAWLSMARSWMAMEKFQQRIHSARDFLQHGLMRAPGLSAKVGTTQRK